ncbi:MAG: hypothetical protein AMXMBFR64_59120 [Myxococcales bacterium]
MNRLLAVVMCAALAGCAGGTEQDAPAELGSVEGALSANAAPAANEKAGPPASAGPKCPGGCSGNGVCWFGKCFCDPGFGGDACEAPDACPSSCSGAGVCFRGTCFCDPGHSGEACELAAACPAGCSKNGVCAYGKCFCNPGFSGESCEAKDPCAGGCSGNGVCAFGKCFCAPGFSGVDCSGEASCPANCSSNGVCAYGKCHCLPGYKGADCSEAEACPSGCSANGVCAFGKCFCVPGYSGDDCSKSDACPSSCSDHGVCSGGKCFCVPGYSGDDCSKSEQAGSFVPMVLADGWTHDGQPPGAWSHLGGAVLLAGQASSFTSGSLIGWLPEDLAPPTRRILLAAGPSGPVRVDIQPDGSVHWTSAKGGWVSLDGVVFTRKGEALEPAVGFGGPLEDTSALHAHLEQGPEGAPLCVLGGTTTTQLQEGAALVTTLPQDCRPKKRLVFGVAASGGPTRVDVQPDGRVYRVGGGSWVSLDGIAFVTAKAEGLPVALNPEWEAATEPPPGESKDLLGAPTAWALGGGLCVLSGVVKPIKGSTSAPVGTLPAKCKSASTFHIGGGSLQIGDPSAIVITDGSIHYEGSAELVVLDAVRFCTSE